MNVLELFSGIGGMHLALKESGVPDGEVKLSIDINPVANAIYKHNFPETTLLHRNIQCLTVKSIEKLNVDTILMSPPCQPFTRNGLQGDVNDERTDAFKYILQLLPELKSITRILMENVKGFENSQMRDLFVSTLKTCNFSFQEYILSPTQLGVPNTRNRYYCIAKKHPLVFEFETGDLRSALPTPPVATVPVSEIVEKSNDLNEFLLPDKVLVKYFNLLDVCHEDSTNSRCFTKAYGRFVEGTGSVFSGKTKEGFDNLTKQMVELGEKDSEKYVELARQLDLRYFTPREVCRLMSFPEFFQFPEEVTNRQKYMVLGNSINVKVVAELIKLLR